MSKQLRAASLIAISATMIATLFNTSGSGAVAQDRQPEAIVQQDVVEVPFTPAESTLAQSTPDQPLPTGEDAPEAQIPDSSVSDAAPPVSPAPSALSLAALVNSQSQDDLSRELACLAGAIYFEAKGTSLSGQLAVGRVIVARSRSGRFPASYCGVVFQPSQFSFVRGRAMPAINQSSRGWREAVAIARIADAGSWRSPVEGALFFHASRVSPGWRLKRVAQVDNHIFYR
jgi:spore germination cell wall hydrolase CwlJ-like protein